MYTRTYTCRHAAAGERRRLCEAAHCFGAKTADCAALCGIVRAAHSDSPRLVVVVSGGVVELVVGVVLLLVCWCCLVLLVEWWSCLLSVC